MAKLDVNVLLCLSGPAWAIFRPFYRLLARQTPAAALRSLSSGHRIACVARQAIAPERVCVQPEPGFVTMIGQFTSLQLFD